MNRIKIHRFIIIMISLGCIGLIADSVMEKWEYWVNPLLGVALVFIWILHIGQFFSERVREAVYLSLTMFAALFHGVHATSFYDVCSVITLMLVLFSLYDRIYVLNLILAEYVFIMAIQFVYVIKLTDILKDAFSFSRVLLQLAIVIAVYFICKKTVYNRLDQIKALKKRDEEVEAYDNDMEDFLANISHELRTPVNVVNGMSMLLARKGDSPELSAIREAGIRLSNQIDDIQDYTEVKQKELHLEEDNYMISSLINDIVSEYRDYFANNELELVMDLDPAVPAMMRGDAGKIKKILRHILDNSIKFTRQGGIYVRIYSMDRDYGVNLCIEVSDTGIGMKRRDIARVGEGIYQANKKRNRSSGGIGLGFPVMYGMVHKMGGFLKIESSAMSGTVIRVTVPQSVVDPAHCLVCEQNKVDDIIFHVQPDKYKVPAVREFYRNMATNLATGIMRPLYSADTVNEVKNLLQRLTVSHIFMGEEEYSQSREYFDELSRGNITVAVSARPGLRVTSDSRVIVMPKPLNGYLVAKVLNSDKNAADPLSAEDKHPQFKGVRALIVDDEPMNLVVASGLFKNEYGMSIDTAVSGREAIMKYERSDYDVIFMDHMMPEMDGVEAMKRIRKVADRTGREVISIALTANAVSGARAMFAKEGFDGFLAKPIDLKEFERIMKNVLSADQISYREDKA